MRRAGVVAPYHFARGWGTAMNRISITIDRAMNGRSVESILHNEMRMSEGFVRRLKRRERGIELNGVRAFTTARVHEGDELSCEAFAERAARPAPLAAEFGILYEDEHIIIINKPAGMETHHNPKAPLSPNAEGALAAYLPEGIVPHPVSRLDRGTTGVMTFAKSAYATELLRRELHTEDFQKEYIGIAVRAPEPPTGEIDLPTGFEHGSHLKRAVRPDGAPSRTGYETLHAERGMALVRLVPHTGRTHQLRLHMAAIGCPLVGDWLYGEEAPGLIARPALHSYKLSLKNPLSGEMISVFAPLPEDMLMLMPGALYLPALYASLTQA